MLLDLNTPSGITLNFKNNLFGDLSKISCSYSYTFKLPITIKNRTILDNAEEIRYRSNMIRKRLKAEYNQNGVNLFSNANLYISEISGNSYSAVLTWNVNDSLERIKNNDVNLNKLEIPGKDLVGTGVIVNATCEDGFSNTEDCLNVVYNCGVPFYNFDSTRNTNLGRQGYNSNGTETPWYGALSGAYPLPVVPVYRILKLIEAKYGIVCRLGYSISKGEYKVLSDEEDVISRGVIPLIGRDLSEADLTKNRCELDIPSLAFVNSKSYETDIKTIIDFGSVKIHGTTNPNSEVSDFWDRSAYSSYKTGIKPKLDNMKFGFDGCISVVMNEPYNSDNEIRLSVLQLQSEYIPGTGGARGTHGRKNYFWKELTSVAGTVEGNRYYFDFATSNGKEQLECSKVEGGGAIMFHINYNVKDLVVNNPIKVYLENDDACTSSHPISLTFNLPDISCLTFLKSLFFMIGAYPMINGNGEIVPQFYSTLKQNKENAHSLDWSAKDKSDAYGYPDSVKFSLSEFAQNNFYLLKSDSTESSSDGKKDEKDIYAPGIGKLVVDNEVLDKEKTIIQLPFYGEYIHNKNWPTYDTGNTLKLWEPSEEEPPTWSRAKMLKFVKGKPCYGVIENRMRTYTDSTGLTSPTSNIMTMKVWNGFQSMYSNPSYEYLQRIISDPYIIKMDMELSEFDLRDIDFLKPIYLNKFNAYFAIVSITRDSKGSCKVELIKLPNE